MHFVPVFKALPRLQTVNAGAPHASVRILHREQLSVAPEKQILPPGCTVFDFCYQFHCIVFPKYKESFLFHLLPADDRQDKGDKHRKKPEERDRSEIVDRISHVRSFFRIALDQIAAGDVLYAGRYIT